MRALSLGMSGARSLSQREERLLVRRSRKLPARNRAMIMAQLFLGFRISEILALTVGHVVHEGAIRQRIALPPRFTKGGYGGTRTIPVANELRRALEHYLASRARDEALTPDAPLFVSRNHAADGSAKSLGRSAAEGIIKESLVAIGEDVVGLSTHSLRKTWAVRLYEESEHDILCVRDGLGHSSVAVTELYLPVRSATVEKLIVAADWTRRSAKAGPVKIPMSTKPANGRKETASASQRVAEATPVAPPLAPEPPRKSGGEVGMLPGLEEFAA